MEGVEVTIWSDNISRETYPEAMTLRELNYWKFCPVLCKKSQTSLGGAGVGVHGEPTWILTEWPSWSPPLEHAESVLGPLAFSEPCIPSAVMCLGCQWLVSRAHDKALAAFLEQVKPSKLFQRGAEIREHRHPWRQSGMQLRDGWPGDFGSPYWIAPYFSL